MECIFNSDHVVIFDLVDGFFAVLEALPIIKEPPLGDPLCDATILNLSHSANSIRLVVNEGAFDISDILGLIDGFCKPITKGLSI